MTLAEGHFGSDRCQWAVQARFIFFNTSGHAAERRSAGSNARIMRGMNAGKRCSAALPDHSTACSDLSAIRTRRSTETW